MCLLSQRAPEPLSHLVFGDSQQRGVSPYANVTQWMRTVWVIFSTVTLLSESWPRRVQREWGHLPPWCHETNAQRVDTTYIRLDVQHVETGLLSESVPFTLWISVRINCHEKVCVTLICVQTSSIDTARLWATVWHRSALGKSMPTSIKQSVTWERVTTELKEGVLVTPPSILQVEAFLTGLRWKAEFIFQKERKNTLMLLFMPRNVFILITFFQWRLFNLRQSQPWSR